MSEKDNMFFAHKDGAMIAIEQESIRENAHAICIAPRFDQKPKTRPATMAVSA